MACDPFTNLNIMLFKGIFCDSHRHKLNWYQKKFIKNPIKKNNLKDPDNIRKQVAFYVNV